MKKYIFLLTIALSFLHAQLSEVEIKKMIGKMIIYGFYSKDIKSTDEIYKQIKKYDLGGVILFDISPENRKKYKNIENPEQLKKLIKQLKAIKKNNLLIAIDQEGGYVQRLNKKQGFIDTKSAKYISSKDEKFAKESYAKLSKHLNEYGINLNFAPVVDLALNSKNKVIFKLNRSFGKSPKEVIKYSSIFVDEMKKRKVISVLKHFPGHGSSLSDSHKGFVDITNTYNNIELKPYEYFIKKDAVDMIMTAHVFNKNLDEKYPATLSHNVNTKLLRNKLGFKGVLVSDDLQMHAIAKHYTLKQAVTLAINSGVNILLFANQLPKNKVLKLETIIDTIYEQIKNNKISLEKIKNSNILIDKLLKKYK